MKRRLTTIALLCLVEMNMSCSSCDTEAYVVSNPPLLVVATDLIDFGAIPLDFTATRTLQLANAGQKELVFDEMLIESMENVFMLAPSENSIRGGQSFELSIGFTPSEERPYEATLKLVSNSHNKAEVTILLLGEGLDDVICGDCDYPPENHCLDAYTLIVYNREGECVEDVCRYVPDYVACPYGCEDSMCLDAEDAGPLPEAEAPDAGEPEVEVPDAGEPEVEVPDAGEPDAGMEIIDAGHESVPQGIPFTMLSMALGETSSCAILWDDVDNQVACWGRYNTLGNGAMVDENSNKPVIIPNFKNVWQIAAGTDHVCAIKLDKTLWCWGDNSHGQLGDGTSTSSATPQEVTDLDAPVYKVALGRMFTCAVTRASGVMESTKVYCWGNGGKGQLGNGDFTDEDSPQLVVGLGEMANVSAMDAGEGHVCVLMSNDNLYCWGENSRGQCLVSGGQDQATAVEVISADTIGEISQLAMGYEHSCISLKDQDAAPDTFCWGGDDFGQMDDGTAGGADTYTPITPNGFSNELQKGIASGGHHTCAINFIQGDPLDRTMSCWGRNTHGACGSGEANVQDAQATLSVETPEGVTWGLIYGGKDHTCAADADHQVYCWGANDFGQLGVGSDVLRKTSPTLVTW